ncbi:diaminopimelate decarboxylase [Moritella sp. 28]|uniref:diaminopimelate decarboxylase n=1 Tax=Moritella sp. 28 TaxID=2746232 RepID=UPI001BAAF461|nr:diaminopimelate decarboxylase [Moritella sp. 28]QUM84136.1 diaminopimelate decarboxylase [Moritella sp. 28]
MTQLTPQLRYLPNVQQQALWLENVSIQQLASQVATPFYCYSKAALLNNIHACKAAFEPENIHIHYAMKANSNLSLLRIVAEQGLGVDIVSIGEMRRALSAGFKAEDIVFSGVGKTTAELTEAVLAGVGQFNLESKEELAVLITIADKYQQLVSALIRVNPEVTVDTHKHITTGAKGNKFGVNFSDVLPMLETAEYSPFLKINGLAMHIGSQIRTTQPYLDAIAKIQRLINELKTQGYLLTQLDLGGGFGIEYKDYQQLTHNIEQQGQGCLAFSDFSNAIKSALAHWQGRISIEPGRSLMADIGVMVCEITYIKESRPTSFIVLDAAMNDLMRPALYQETHALIPVQSPSSSLQTKYDVVGPICESTDTFSKSASLPTDLAAGDLMCFLYTGAYCAVMSNSYNSRPIAAEILVDDAQAYVIRQAITQDDLMAFEQHRTLIRTIPKQSVEVNIILSATRPRSPDKTQP